MSQSSTTRFFTELRRRKVIRVAVVYPIVAWILVEAASVVMPELLLPDWSVRLVLVLAIIGFPIALVLAWAFDISPEGVRRAIPAREKTGEEMGAVGVAEALRTTGADIAHDKAARNSIAVLPFSNMSDEPGSEYFSDGMSEELINVLAKLPSLRVASRTSSFYFKGKNVKARTIADELGVGTILEGSVRRSDNRIRITAQLIDAVSDSHLWSETYDRELEDVFAVQDEIAENIVRALQVTLTPRERQAIQKVPTTDVRAYDFYLRGRKFFYQVHRGGIEFAHQMFLKAKEIDPNFARAYAGIADTSAWIYAWHDKSDSVLERADRASRRALELDPDLAEAHATRGHVLTFMRRYDEAEREFETAIRIDPRLYEAYYFYARSNYAQGKLEKAAELYEKATVVSPEDCPAVFLLAQTYRELGREQEANEMARRGLTVAERNFELNPDDARALYLGAGALVVLGEKDRGLEWAARAIALNPDDSSILYNLVCIYALAGETEQALDSLEKLVRQATGQKGWIEHDSDLDSLRDHPRFQALLKEFD